MALSDGNDLAYIDEGDGDEVLLFVHGLGSYLPAWRKNMLVLQHLHRCIALDLPGYGKSTKRLPEGLLISYYASTIIELMDHLELNHVTLVGHSMGGQTSILTSLQYSNRISKLILAAPAGFEKFNSRESAFMRQAFNSKAVMKLPAKKIAKNIRYNFHKFPEDAQFMIADRLMMRASEDFEAYSETIPRCIAGMLDEPVHDRLHELRQPTLVVFGRQDNLIPNRFLKLSNPQTVAEAGAKKIPKCHLIMVNSAGHFVMYERSRVFNQAVVDFMMHGMPD